MLVPAGITTGGGGSGAATGAGAGVTGAAAVPDGAAAGGGAEEESAGAAGAGVAVDSCGVCELELDELLHPEMQINPSTIESAAKRRMGILSLFAYVFKTASRICSGWLNSHTCSNAFSIAFSFANPFA
jgi:hypothetical protein